MNQGLFVTYNILKPEARFYQRASGQKLWL